MRHLIRLNDLTRQDVERIFSIADEVRCGGHANALAGKCVVMFFPDTSIRTRVTFDKGIHLLGGFPVLFPPETLDKKEALEDVCGYLNQWADVLVVRHGSIDLVEQLARYSAAPVINAMTAVNHPCEILSDLYAIARRGKSLTESRFLFCGRKGNIGLAWKEASEVLGFRLEQCCAPGYEIPGLISHHDINEAVRGKDIVCTDSLGAAEVEAFRACQVTREVMAGANAGALLNPCPPFYRGEEVSADVIDSEYFVGYGFKKHLLEIQQAVMIDCLSHE